MTALSIFPSKFGDILVLERVAHHDGGSFSAFSAGFGVCCDVSESDMSGA
jgi:hypothetical protein